MRLLLEQMSNDPGAVREHLQNPEIMQKLMKLREAGIIKLRWLLDMHNISAKVVHRSLNISLLQLNEYLMLLMLHIVVSFLKRDYSLKIPWNEPHFYVRAASFNKKVNNM